jgi:cytoskeleton-associated protein 5
MKYFREDLNRRLLSPDFKKQVDGLEMLHKVFGYFLDYWRLLLSMAQCYQIETYMFFFFQALPSIGKEIIEVLDILLRWFVLQFCKSNTTCLLKVYIYIFFPFCHCSVTLHVLSMMLHEMRSHEV